MRRKCLGTLQVANLVLFIGCSFFLLIRSSPAQEAPWELVQWKPAADNAVFAGTGSSTWDRKIRERGFILIADDGTFHLWYTGYDHDRPTTMSLGHATSRDGVHWTRDPNNPIFAGSWTEDVCVVKQDGVYQMFAEGKNDIAHRLSSRDGLHWTDHGSLHIFRSDGQPISPGPYGTPTGWFESGTWYLFYERGDQGVWLATSPDLEKWTNVKDEPVLARGPGEYDSRALALNQIVKRGAYYYAYYHASAGGSPRVWTSNVARSRDLVHWEKYPGNPIVQNNCSSPILVTTPQGDRLYTMHPDVKVFEPAPKTRSRPVVPR